MVREKTSSINTMSTPHEPETSMEWSAEDEIQLFFALDGLKPVGVNRHFNMFFASERLSKSLNRDIPTQQIWEHLNTMYNLEMLEEIEPLPFPNDITDFSLPEAEFAAYISKKRIESEENKFSDNGSDIVVKDKIATKSKTETTSITGSTSQNAKEIDKKVNAKSVDLPKRMQKRTRGSISLESSSPSTTPPPAPPKRRRI